MLAVLACHRPRYARVAQLAGFGAQFTATGEFEVVEQIDGIGMTDMFGLSGQHAYREAFAEGIHEQHASGEPARSWALQFLIRRCAWRMLDYAWELEDRDLTNEPG